MASSYKIIVAIDNFKNNAWPEVKIHLNTFAKRNHAQNNLIRRLIHAPILKTDLPFQVIIAVKKVNESLPKQKKTGNHSNQNRGITFSVICSTSNKIQHFLLRNFQMLNWSLFNSVCVHKPGILILNLNLYWPTSRT